MNGDTDRLVAVPPRASRGAGRAIALRPRRESFDLPLAAGPEGTRRNPSRSLPTKSPRTRLILSAGIATDGPVGFADQR